jgi:hypothetical protein
VDDILDSTHHPPSTSNGDCSQEYSSDSEVVGDFMQEYYPDSEVVDSPVGYPDSSRTTILHHSAPQRPDSQKIINSFYWACFRVEGLIFPQRGQVDQRQNSLVISFKRRFPDLIDTFHKVAPPPCAVIDVTEIQAKFTLSHFGARCIVVKGQELMQQLKSFCEQQTWIAIDTESAPSNSRCDLVQIGNDKLVYLVAVCENREYLRDIAKILACEPKTTVFQFGSDDFQKFARQVGVSHIMCKVQDVQLPQSESDSKRISIGALFSRTFTHEQLVLSKTWRISGWDNPVLHSQQEEYAALDVVCLSMLAKVYHPQMCQ